MSVAMPRLPSTSCLLHTWCVLLTGIKLENRKPSSQPYECLTLFHSEPQARVKEVETLAEIILQVHGWLVCKGV